MIESRQTLEFARGDGGCAPGDARGMCVISYGVRIGLRAAPPDMLDRLTARLPPGWGITRSLRVERTYALVCDSAAAKGSAGGLYVLCADGQRLSQGPELQRVCDVFESNVQLYVAEMAPRHVFVHAGAVGWRERAIIVPGRSLSGKTTLVAELVRAGATYYSDEYAVLDAQGQVHPYPAPLSIRQAEGNRPRKCSVEALGGRRGEGPLSVGLVVVSEYQRGAVWQGRPLSAGRGILALLANTVSIRRQPTVALAVLQRVVARAPVLEGVRGEASETVQSLLREL